MPYPRCRVTEKRPFRLYNADCLSIVNRMEDNSVATIITDPPYGLSFMGKNWDRGVPGVPFWKSFLRVAKPGAFLFAFGGTRTYHRLVCAIEDAGWEIRDGIIWLYGQGFPKSHNIGKALDKAAGAEREVVRTPMTPHSTAGKGLSNELDERPWMTKARELGYHEHAGDAPATDAAKEWDGWGTALSPSHEPICVAMKPLDKTFAANAMAHGVAGLNIDGARIPVDPDDPINTAVWTTRPSAFREGTTGTGFLDGSTLPGDKRSAKPPPAGRWPKNVILSDDECVKELFPETGASPSTYKRKAAAKSNLYGDSGSASRYFYTAKASKRERGEGNNHPTVKPLALMEYLCRLTMTPTGGTVFDPFMGSGTTGVACMNLGRRFIGCDNDTEHGYFEIAESRIEEARKVTVT